MLLDNRILQWISVQRLSLWSDLDFLVLLNTHLLNIAYQY